MFSLVLQVIWMLRHQVSSCLPAQPCRSATLPDSTSLPRTFMTTFGSPNYCQPSRHLHLLLTAKTLSDVCNARLKFGHDNWKSTYPTSTSVLES
ncbi:hypothetical protein JAAARDRAFT_501925 [Jaapia argillacea MUCL 33604]|uniref:Secreted protein n=1 Tax=Jaapia argillacea MUCL 33604 TaxID=933084 RepID=A0A067PCV6_9AGAM|nr:hypothetical protein JAAARDRAFT_501925 [Jaapia argillacea MUCL 33604]